MHYDLTAEQFAEHQTPVRHRARHQRRRRLLRHHARVHPPLAEPSPTSTPAARDTRPTSRRRHLDLLASSRSSRTRRSSSSASAPTPTARRSSATPCSRATGTARVQMAKDQVTRGRPRPRRLRRLRRPRRHRRHGRDRQPLRHPVQRPARARLDRARGDGGRPPVDRRPGHPQLGQPRGRRRRGSAASTGSFTLAREYGAAVICLLHRRGGPGPRRRVEDARRPPHPRPGRRTATASSRAT